MKKIENNQLANYNGGTALYELLLCMGEMMEAGATDIATIAGLCALSNEYPVTG